MIIKQTFTADVSRFTYKSFRLQVDLRTSRSFHLYKQVVSPTWSESIRPQAAQARDERK